MAKMPNEMNKRPAGYLTPEQALEFVDNPLKQVPPAFRMPIWDFWSAWSHILKNQMALSSRVRHWIADGLTLEDLTSALAELSAPEAEARITFAGELLSELSGLIATRMKARRERAEVEARRREAAEFNDPASRTVVRDLLRNWRSGGTTTPESDQP